MSKGFDLIKLGVGGVVVAGAVLAGSLVSNGMVQKGGAPITQQSSSSVAPKSSEEPIPEINPITDDIKKIAEDFVYDVDPLSVVMPEQEEWDYDDAELAKVPYTMTREGHDLIYYFEGRYSEGYQGDYSPTYCYLYLWEDGYFGGVSGKENVRGFWYNSSLEAPEDDPSTEENEAIDCLNMVSNLTHYESISSKPKNGFYKYQAYMYLDMGKVWGQGSNARSIIMNGYPYYPEVALYIDTQMTEDITFKVNEDNDIRAWTPSRVLKNLEYSSILVQTDVTWSIADDVKAVLDENGQPVLDENGDPTYEIVNKASDIGSISVKYSKGQKTDGTCKFTSAGKHQIKIAWNGLSATLDVNVVE